MSTLKKQMFCGILNDFFKIRFFAVAEYWYKYILM